MIKINIEGIYAVQARLAQVRDDLVPKVLSPALNKIASAAQAEVTRAIIEDYNVSASEVRNAVELRRASGRNLQAVITIFGSASKKGRSMNLVHFLAAVQAAGKAFKTRRGSKLKKADLSALAGQLGFIIKKGAGAKTIAGAFVGNKGRTIFVREGPGRLPIKPLQVIGFAQMFNSRRISQRVAAKIAQDIPVEIDRAIQMVLARFGGNA